MTEPLATTRAQRTFADRIIGSVRLDANVYDEIEHDPSAMGQAAAVVALAAVATEVGGALGSVGGFAGAIIGGLLGWLASAAIVWLVGGCFMRNTPDYSELLRTLGFASAPRMIAVLGIVPILGSLAWPVAGIWGLLAYVVAVRQALDVRTGRAIVVCVLAYLVGVAIYAALAFLVLGPPGASRTNIFAP